MAIRRQQSEARRLKRHAKRRIDTLEVKKNRINEKVGKDVFEEVNESKSYLFGLIKYKLSGLKIAPTNTWRYGNFMVRKTIDSVFLAGFGYVLKIKDWRVRSESKPKEAKGNYIIKLNKYEKPRKA